jgi:hypothetical protein
MVGEGPAVSAEHVRFAVYHDRCTRGVHATVNPALQTKSRSCLKSTTSVPALPHVVGELFNATEICTSAASKQCSLFGPVVGFGSKVISMRWARDDGTEVTARESEVDDGMKLELVDDS